MSQEASSSRKQSIVLTCDVHKKIKNKSKQIELSSSEDEDEDNVEEDDDQEEASTTSSEVDEEVADLIRGVRRMISKIRS